MKFKRRSRAKNPFAPEAVRTPDKTEAAILFLGALCYEEFAAALLKSEAHAQMAEDVINHVLATTDHSDPWQEHVYSTLKKQFTAHLLRFVQGAAQQALVEAHEVRKRAGQLAGGAP